MSRSHGAAALIAAAIAAAPPARAQAYFENGYFDRPQPPAGSFAVLDVGERYGTWRVVGAAGTVSWVKTDYVHRGFQFVSPKHSTAWVNLAGTSQTATGIAHSPVPTKIGTSYKLTFMVGNIVDPTGVYGQTSTVLVYENSSLVGSVTNSSGSGSTAETWMPFTMTFKADRAWTVISFINGDPPGDGNCGIGDVGLAPVTGPSSGTGRSGTELSGLGAAHLAAERSTP